MFTPLMYILAVLVISLYISGLGRTIHRSYPGRNSQPFVQYICSREELKRLLDGITGYQKKLLKVEPVTLRAMLLLIYGAGLL